MTAPIDEDLAAAFRSWWATVPDSQFDVRPAEVAMAEDLADLQAHLSAHGFAIVRRLAADPPPLDPVVATLDEIADAPL